MSPFVNQVLLPICLGAWTIVPYYSYKFVKFIAEKETIRNMTKLKVEGFVHLDKGDIEIESERESESNGGEATS